MSEGRERSGEEMEGGWGEIEGRYTVKITLYIEVERLQLYVYTVKPEILAAILFSYSFSLHILAAINISVSLVVFI